MTKQIMSFSCADYAIPAPTWAESAAEDGVIEERTGEETEVVCVVGHPDLPLSERDRRNKALLLSAPAMLAALKKAEAFAEQMRSGVRFSDRAAAADRLLTTIRAALPDEGGA